MNANPIFRAGEATIEALRSDIALQIARDLKRRGGSQVVLARELSVPQPTISKIVNGRVSQLSLELLIRIAVRANLVVVLQTGAAPEEAGAYVSRGTREIAHRAIRSKVAEAARDSMVNAARALTPEQRLEAHLRHSELVTALQQASRTTKGRESSRLRP